LPYKADSGVSLELDVPPQVLVHGAPALSCGRGLYTILRMGAYPLWLTAAAETRGAGVPHHRPLAFAKIIYSRMASWRSPVQEFVTFFILPGLVILAVLVAALIGVSRHSRGKGHW